MIIPSDVKCKDCGKVFCCAKCRLKHENNEHADLPKIKEMCFICNNKPFPLHLHHDIDSNDALFQHILKQHLPLYCNKCKKLFKTVDDFEEISKCHQKSCTLETTVQQTEEEKSSAETIENSSPEPNDHLEPQLTPLSKWNLKWKRKSQSMIDSIVSNPNVSAVHHSSSIQASPKAKPVVRTTSTPFLHFNHPSKLTNESYSVSSQMSSIHQTSEDNESVHNSPQSPTPKELYKMKAALRSRSKVAATPLRQVMSKSIQRAIAQHTRHYTKGIINPSCQRKMSFDSTSSSGQNSQLEEPSIIAPSPLDLRMSPALKRSNSDASSFLFRKPRPVKSSSASDSSECSQPSVKSGPFARQYSIENPIEQNRNNELVDDHLHTPRNAGAIPKKIISFITPADVTKENNDINEQDCEIWGTPCAPLTRSYTFPNASYSYRNSDSIMTEDNSNIVDDDVFLPSKLKTGKQPQHGSKLWSIVSNVIKLASGSDPQEEEMESNDAFGATTLIKRAASFAGYLTKQYYNKAPSQSPEEQEYNLKRRRTVSIVTNDPNSIQSPCAKRKRIQGRQPIDRMKNLSFNSSSG